MDDGDFESFLNRDFQLYQEGAYMDAFHLINEEADHFPERFDQTWFWQICLAARAGRVGVALARFQEALNAGYWWSEAMLRSDADLVGLQANGEFERLVDICRERHEMAQAKPKPEVLHFHPQSGSPPPWPALIALHGRGSSAQNDAVYWKGAADLGWLTSLPQSSQLFSPTSAGWDNPEESEEEIVAHYQDLRSQFLVDPDCLVLGGFSQGAGLAIRLALSGVLPTVGFIAVAPSFGSFDILESLLQKRHQSILKGILVAGGQDRRFDAFRKLHHLLEEHEIYCLFEEYPRLGHAYPQDFRTKLVDWLSRIQNRTIV